MQEDLQKTNAKPPGDDGGDAFDCKVEGIWCWFDFVFAQNVGVSSKENIGSGFFFFQR